MDWDKFLQRCYYNINNYGKATVVLGYWTYYKPKDARERKESPFRKLYQQAYVLQSKEEQEIFIQNFPDKKYAVIVLFTRQDLNGDPILDPEKQIKGCIKVDGYVVEETMGTTISRYRWNALAENLAIQNPYRMRLFSMYRYPKEKKEKEKPKRKKKTKAD